MSFRTAMVLATVLVTGRWMATPSVAQTRTAVLEDLKSELSPGDSVVVTDFDGKSVVGKLVRFGRADLDIRPAKQDVAPAGTLRHLTIPLTGIKSLERPRDPVRNGTLIGAGIGAGVGTTLIVSALIVDRNDADEWAGPFLVGTAILSGVGGLVGWAIDAARSKPHVRFDAVAGAQTRVSVQPLVSGSPGIAIVVTTCR